MSCTSKTCSATVTLPAAVRWHWPALVGAIVTLAEAFREALAMRRVMSRTHNLNDE
jgi:hypothetical protein